MANTIPLFELKKLSISKLKFEIPELIDTLIRYKEKEADRLILLATDENDIVLDPFSGTGTTAISAKRLGRKYIGFELDKDYARISLEKLDKTKSNFKIGNIWASFYLNDIVTIRNKDWNDLKHYFHIPTTTRAIDNERVKIKDKKLISREPIISTYIEEKMSNKGIEFHGKNSENATNKRVLVGGRKCA